MHLLKTKLFWTSVYSRFYLVKKNFGRLNCGYCLEEWGYIKFLLTFLNQTYAFLYYPYIYMLMPKLVGQFELLSRAKAYLRWVQIFLAGHSGRFKALLYLYGIGRRMVGRRKRFLILTLGFHHEIQVFPPRHMRFRRWRYRRSKHSFKIVSNNLFDLKNAVFVFRRLRFPDVYNANGIRLFKEKIVLKRRKKWGVF